MRLRHFAIALAGVAGCRGNPSSPALTIPSVGGQWGGTLESSNYQPLSVSMTLSQSTDNLTGTWAEQSAGVATGTISGNAGTMGLAGTVTFTVPGQTTSCTAPFSATVFGTPSTMTLVVSTLSGNCSLSSGNPLSPKFVLQRR